MAYTKPADDERPILFRFLKQQSSYTIWRQIVTYMDAWVEEAKRIAPLALDPADGEPALNDSELRLLFLCRAAAADAVASLRAGNQAVFKWLGWGTGQGYFCEAGRALDAWLTALGRIEEGLPLAQTPYWPAFKRRFDDFLFAWSNGGNVLEPRHTDVPAPIDDMRLLNGGLSYAAPHPAFEALRLRAASLPRVPVPPREVIVPTGESIPCFGIWEPVKLDLTPGIIGFFKKPVLPADGKFEIDGCMNYLHAGSPAPTIGFEEDGLRGEGRPTVWRLLWRDDRYKDGTVPEEEQEYVFVPPPAAATEPRAKNEELPDLIIARSGHPAPEGGTWAAKERLHARVQVTRHEPLPQLDGQAVEWVYVPER